ASEWRGWRQWKSFVEQSKVAELKQVMTGEKHKRAAEMIRRWRLQSMVPAFERWKEYSRERGQHKRDTLRHTLARMMNAQLWSGWRHWRSYVEAERVAEYKKRVFESQNKRRSDLI